MKHTQEPWTVRGEYIIGGHGGGCVAHSNYKPLLLEKRTANLTRIVTCVNALTGIQNPAAIPEVVEALKRIAIQDCDTNETHKAGVEYMQRVARTALAKLEERSEG